MAEAGIKRMADLAALAGVSAMTVHRALHDHPGIKAATRLRILDLARKHRYRPNGIARAMRQGRTGTVGLAVGPADIEMATLVGIHRVLNAAGMNLSFAEIPYPGQVAQPAPPRFFAENLLDGLICHAGVLGRTAMPEWLASPNVPTLCIMGKERRDCIVPDYATQVPRACAQLLAGGYRNVVYVGPVHAPFFHPAAPILGHFRTWAKAAGKGHGEIATDTEIPPGEWMAGLAARLRRERGRIALLAASANDARRCHAVIHDLGIACPKRAGLLAFATRNETTDGGLAIDACICSSFALGEEAARMLLERIAQDGARIPSRTIPFAYRPGQTLAAAEKRNGERSTSRRHKPSVGTGQEERSLP
jgi:DNA-binding LacI/PurR family transcriptional regulator